MYRIIINGTTDTYEYAELIKVFLKPEEFVVYDWTSDTQHTENADVTEYYDIIVDAPNGQAGNIENIENIANVKSIKNNIKRELFIKLKGLTGKNPPWGILTGVRPVKLTGELFEKLFYEEAVFAHLTDFYMVREDKARLLIDTYKYQQEKLTTVDENSAGVYIGIPFCPTRCLYCSFTSNQKGPEDIERYLAALLEEIRYAGKKMKEKGLWTESLYIGGGTPTTLTAQQLDSLITAVKESFDLSRCLEFTVEAGRPDTITKEKLAVIKAHGIDRISINPQTMKDETLKLIGRNHTVEDIKDAFNISAGCGDFIVNADLIAGLPGEDIQDFKNTLKDVISLGPANITVHTLAVKKASRLIEADPDYHYRQGDIVAEMLDEGSRMLKEAGYRPYYLYRQKHMAGALENVGYCKGDTPCVYNIRIMEEKQSILALGAGGISKKYYPAENRLERVPNVSNYEIYIERLDEMIERKEKNFFEEV